MKQHKRLPLALLLVFALCIQTLSFTSAAAALADPEPVFSASDMTFSSGTDAVALPQSAVTQLSGLSSGTIIVDFFTLTTGASWAWRSGIMGRPAM